MCEDEMKQGYYIHFSAKWMPGIAKKMYAGSRIFKILSYDRD